MKTFKVITKIVVKTCLFTAFTGALYGATHVMGRPCSIETCALTIAIVTWITS